MEALAPWKGCGWTKGPERCKQDLIGVTAVVAFVSANAYLASSP